ncbi:MAG: preprotein translocase subunit SecY [Deltaproteobacteria bacterium]|nr:preprotein translocase subunit SecY [Deltaproteobacteria bacterium]
MATTLASLANWHKVPELRRRVLFSLGMLAVYRVGVFVTTPGVDRNAMKQFVGENGAGLVGFLNLFSGGALGNLSIFALGIMPYISSSIILQLLGMVYPPLAEMRKEGEAGRRKIEQYTRYGTIVLSCFQSYALATAIQGKSVALLGSDTSIVNDPGPLFIAMTMITLTTGTAFLMWLGEQITERGIGNGTSLIIMSGIVARVPETIIGYVQQSAGDPRPLNMAAVAGAFLACIAVVAFFENGRRLIPIVYSRRQVGMRVYGAQQAQLPLKINTSGVIPPIFASSLLMFPATLASLNVPGMQKLQTLVTRGDWVFNTGFAVLIVFFCFFYTGIVFQPVEVAENLKKQQANIPNVRPGKQTADYIERVVNRITVAGAVYVAAICTLPSMFGQAIRMPITFGGTTIMIVVGVALDTMSQIEGHLIKRSYEGLTGPSRSKVRGRRPGATPEAEEDAESSMSSSDTAESGA